MWNIYRKFPSYAEAYENYKPQRSEPASFQADRLRTQQYSYILYRPYDHDVDLNVCVHSALHHYQTYFYEQNQNGTSILLCPLQSQAHIDIRFRQEA